MSTSRPAAILSPTVVYSRSALFPDRHHSPRRARLAAVTREPAGPALTGPTPRGDPDATNSGSDPAPAGDGAVDQQHNDSSEDGQQPGPEVEEVTQATTEDQRTDPAAEDSADDAQDEGDYPTAA